MNGGGCGNNTEDNEDDEVNGGGCGMNGGEYTQEDEFDISGNQNGGKKKKLLKKSPKKGVSKKGVSKKGVSKKGGGSDWLAVQYAQGPSNNPDKPWGGCGQSNFANFADPSQYVPNSVLRSGWANPVLAGVEKQMCGSR